MRRLAFAIIMTCVSVASVYAEAEGEVRIKGSSAFSITSSVNGERFRIFVWQPSGPVPENGFPVFYSFDGNESFAMLSDVAASLAPAARRAGMRPVMVVAIGYDDKDVSIDRRTYDLTPRADAYVMPERPNNQPWPKLGGGDDLLDTIERDIKPLIANKYPTDQTSATLFGHSLGGLMTLHALISRPDSYQRYFSSSPSLWVNDRKMLRDMETFLKSSGENPVGAFSLRLSVGTLEEDVSPWELRAGGDISAREAWVKGNRMVGNATDLAALINADIDVEADFQFELLTDMDHRSSHSFAAWKAMRFAMEAE